MEQNLKFFQYAVNRMEPKNNSFQGMETINFPVDRMEPVNISFFNFNWNYPGVFLCNYENHNWM